MKYLSLFAILLSALLLPALAPAQTYQLPYTLSFVPVTTATGLPALQSYCIANVSATQWIILGGRINLGLHQFNPPPANNFSHPNTILWSINPVTGTALQVADLSKLDPSVGDPFTSTNQPCEYNPQTGYWYIVGGYGLSHAANAFVTFPTIFQIPVGKLVDIANSQLPPAKMQQATAYLLQQPALMITNPAMKVTGGALSHNQAGLEFLSFGRIFDGSYNPFGGGFTQTYTQSVLPFTINLSPFSIHTLQPITSTEKNAPFNRRDFAAAYDIDPTTGLDRFAVWGGVFRSGASPASTTPSTSPAPPPRSPSSPTTPFRSTSASTRPPLSSYGTAPAPTHLLRRHRPLLLFADSCAAGRLQIRHRQRTQ
jgi:hypothetical protein